MVMGERALAGTVSAWCWPDSFKLAVAVGSPLQTCCSADMSMRGLGVGDVPMACSFMYFISNLAAVDGVLHDHQLLCTSLGAAWQLCGSLGACCEASCMRNGCLHMLYDLAAHSAP